MVERSQQDLISHQETGTVQYHTVIQMQLLLHMYGVMVIQQRILLVWYTVLTRFLIQIATAVQVQTLIQ